MIPVRSTEGIDMKFHVIVYEERDGGFSAEVPALPGCFTEGDTMDALISHVTEAIEGYLEAREQVTGIPVPNEYQKSARLLEVTV